MKGHGGNLEAQAINKNAVQHRQRTGSAPARVQNPADVVDIGGTGGSENQRHAVEKNAVANEPSRKYFRDDSLLAASCRRKPVRM